jgi:hypothetical protein
MIDSVDFLGVFMGNKGSHRGSSVRGKNDSVLADDADRGCHLGMLILDGFRFSNLSCIRLFSLQILAFRETERFEAESVSDSLKTFSATIVSLFAELMCSIGHCDLTILSASVFDLC